MKLRAWLLIGLVAAGLCSFFILLDDGDEPAESKYTRISTGGARAPFNFHKDTAESNQTMAHHPKLIFAKLSKEEVVQELSNLIDNKAETSVISDALCDAARRKDRAIGEFISEDKVPESTQIDALPNFLNTFTNDELANAANWIANIKNKNTRAFSYDWLAARWLSIDPESASMWINNLVQSPEKTAACSALIRWLQANPDVPGIKEWWNSLPEGDVKRFFNDAVAKQ